MCSKSQFGVLTAEEEFYGRTGRQIQSRGFPIYPVILSQARVNELLIETMSRLTDRKLSTATTLKAAGSMVGLETTKMHFL